jgi:hypothetical protein
MLARIWRTSSYGAVYESTVEASMESVLPENSVFAPNPSRTASIVSTSFMRGTLWRTVLPGARSAAAISFRAAFLAPETSTSP